MTDARPQLSKAELAHALRELKGFSADLETQTGYEASAALISEIMADPVQRERLVSLLEQFDERHTESSGAGWVNDGAPFDKSPKSLVLDDLYFDFPTGAEDDCLTSGSTVATVRSFLNKYKEEMTGLNGFKYAASGSTLSTCIAAESQIECRAPAEECQDNAPYDVEAWSKVLVLAKQKLQGKATRRTSLVARLAQAFYGGEPPEWEVEKCPITKASLLVILHHGNEHASIGFVGSGQSAYVMVSINDTALTMNESFQNPQKFAARIADFFIDAPKSGHKAIHHMLRAL